MTREEAKVLLGDLEKRHPQLHDMALLSLRTRSGPRRFSNCAGSMWTATSYGLYITQKGGKRGFVRVPEVGSDALGV